MSRASLASALVPVLLVGAAALVPLACADGGTVDQGFKQQSGAGGGGDGGAGGASSTSAGDGATTSSTGATTGATTSSSTTSSTMSTTTSSSTTSSSSGAGGGSCDDTGPEPNETEDTATFLASISDCDGSGSKVDGVLDGGDDVDWYRYKASDTFGCTVDPTRDVTSVGSLRICKFFECISGTAEVTCPDGTIQASSPGGRPGCCSLTGFTADLNCNGPVSDDAQVYVRIDNPDQAACLAYELAYHY